MPTKVPRHELTTAHRKTVVVNLDPANDILPYDCGVDLTELVDLKKVMETKKLGPNGGNGCCAPVIVDAER